jgi:hypothetical protein
MISKCEKEGIPKEIFRIDVGMFNPCSILDISLAFSGRSDKYPLDGLVKNSKES